MAITTLDGALAGMLPPNTIAKVATPTLVAGRPQSLWGLGGTPGAGAFDTTLNGVALTAPVTGQIPFTNPTGGAFSYLARWLANCNQPGLVMLCDRLWHNGGYTITATTAQNSTTPTFPARDRNGSTNGDGVYLGVEVSAATGAGTPTLTASYTNSAGTAGRIATNIDPAVASSAAGAFYRLGLQAGDQGVRSLQSLTLSATWTSGTINVVAYRVIASIPITAAGVPGVVDALTGGFARLYDGSVPFLLFVPAGTAAAQIGGDLIVTQG